MADSKTKIDKNAAITKNIATLLNGKFEEQFTGLVIEDERKYSWVNLHLNENAEISYCQSEKDANLRLYVEKAIPKNSISKLFSKISGKKVWKINSRPLYYNKVSPDAEYVVESTIRVVNSTPRSERKKYTRK